MGNFSIPIKQLIANKDNQIVVTTSGPLAGAVGQFTLAGFLSSVQASQLEILPDGDRMRVTPFAAAVQHAIEVTFTTGAADGDVFKVQTDSLDLTPTEYQNQPVEKRYQLPLCADATATATAAAAAINADPHALVIASHSAGVLTLGAKSITYFILAYASESNVTLLPAGVTNAVTVQGTLGTGTYDTLKNIEFAKNVDFDRNAEYYPARGGEYNQYYWEVNWITVDLGGHDVPSLLPASGRTAFQIWAVDGGAVDTALDAIATAVNV